MQDYSDIKSRLKEYLQIRGIEVKKNILKCPNPYHADATPSAVFYSKGKNSPHPNVWCPICQQTWNIFAVAALLDNIGKDDFEAQLKSVSDTLRITVPEMGTPAPKKPDKPVIPISHDKRREVYKADFIKQKASEKGWGTDITGVWEYTDKDDMVIGIDVRFEGGEKKKEVITWYYNGSLKWFGAPVMLYNLYEVIKSDKPVLIVEGCKCAELARQLPAFTPCSSSGGSAKAKQADWIPLKDKEVFILRDADEPGLKYAREIQKIVPQVKIIKPVTTEQGDDIEQFLIKLNPELLTSYILNPDNIEVIEEESPESPSDMCPPHTMSDTGDSSSVPFKILGIGDDGRANFITEAGRHVSYALESVSKEKLRVLANKFYWQGYYKFEGKMDYESAIDDIIRFSERKDFNMKNLRGRGAWRDGDKISYHDGVNTFGEYAKDKIYVRSSRKDIGIEDTPIEIDKIKKIRETIFKLSFETPTDAVRCMSWAVLAPFCGALPFRPAILLTGASGTGKTTVATLMINKLAESFWLNGSETSVAGIRGLIKRDSYPIVFDETEADTDKKKINRDELLSLMRSNTSDDTPDTVKGTKEGGFVSYKMQNIFAFIGIDPTIEHAADENRIFRINMIKKNQGDWKKLDKEIHQLLTDENCRAIRSLAWQKLKIIFALSDSLTDAVRDKTGRDFRSSLADSLLLAAFFVIWNGLDNPDEKIIDETLDKYYDFQPAEEHRDESEEIINRLMEQQIEILGDGAREKITIMECINRIYIGEIEDHTESGGWRILTSQQKAIYRRHLSMYGMKVMDGGQLAIVNQHHEIKKIIGYDTGYAKLLRRYAGLVDPSKNVTYSDGKGKRSTILNGIIKKKESDKTEDEKLVEVI